MKRIFTLTILSVFVFYFGFGCSRSSKPEGFPQLYPCKITITQDGSPLEGATVSLVPFDQSGWKWRSSGQTDASGAATVMTYGYKGSPAGKFKIIVEKKIEEDPIHETNVYGEKQISGYESIYTLIDEKFTKAETTSLTVEIPESGKGASANFDVGKAVKIKL
ncbi:MAG: hypothetical protein LBP59_07645 [Planctomycetaceae bacterium]|jgi:hypothetical protein|nr:hypothetical protein [Planctomycetaceae bacterium]